MRIIADKNIPYLAGIAEQFGTTTYLAGNDFTKEALKDADTLIVRTVVPLGKDLLEGSKVKLICSATIGYDHIDTIYCESHGIAWTNAPGCNSGSVEQYIASSLLILAQKHHLDLSKMTIGIVGVGNVGTKVAKICRVLGMKVLLNDPPREEKESSRDFVSLETIKQNADIITFHTPLYKSGEYKTFHLADDTFFDSLTKKPFIINAARGAIIDSNAIKKALETEKIKGAVIDCWENEPNIDLDLLQKVDIATPHIAGYSADGKANATRMSLISLANFWGLDPEIAKQVKPKELPEKLIDLSTYGDEKWARIKGALLFTYNTSIDDKDLRLNTNTFKDLRNNYRLRREYNAFTVINYKKEERELLKSLGFKIDA